MTLEEILTTIREIFQTVLKGKLTGIYVHGSIAFGCFNRDKSDIDFLVVVKEALTQQEKEEIIRLLLQLDEHCPPKGMEMSVVQEKVCMPFHYPTPYELHYSNAHREKYIADLPGYCEMMHGTDKDLAAHITVTRTVGLTLWGKPVQEVFGEVPKADYIDSILFDVENAEKGIQGDPVYYVLNLCRVCGYLEENIVMSKKQGGEWGMNGLPGEYRKLLQSALKCYEGSDILETDAEKLKRFAEYMKKRIKHLSQNE